MALITATNTALPGGRYGSGMSTGAKGAMDCLDHYDDYQPSSFFRKGEQVQRGSFSSGTSLLLQVLFQPSHAAEEATS